MRFVDHRGAKTIVLVSETIAPQRQWSFPQIRSARDHHARRFPGRMRIDRIHTLKPLHFPRDVHNLILFTGPGMHTLKRLHFR